jgi:hypothetical protein
MILLKVGETMKKPYKIIGCILVLLILSVVPAAAQSASSQTSTDPASQIIISSYDLDPAVFYPYETGTVTVHVTNPSNTTVGLCMPDLIGNNVIVTNKNSFSTVTTVGSGSTVDYSFTFTMDATDGTYYPLFTVSPKDWGSIPIHSQIKVVVDSKDLKAVVSDKPDSFPASVDKSVNLTLINPRSGELKNIEITAYGDGMQISPEEKYVSSLAAESSVDVPFTVSATRAGNLTFHISYQNGDNIHTKDVVLPVTIGNDKTAAAPVVNNVALTSKGSYYDITGDITNAGISDAKGLVVSVGSPAQGTETYPEYAIGSLASDDSNSFELTFTTQDLSAVPIVITWKDSTGNSYEDIKTVDLSSSSSAGGTTSGNKTSKTRSSSSMGGPGGSGGPSGDMGGPGGSSSSSLLGITTSNGGGASSFYPLVAVVILLVAGIVGYKKRKWIMAKLKKQ